jgi:cytochrome P450
MPAKQESSFPNGEIMLAPKPDYVPDYLVVDFDIYNPPGTSSGQPLQESWKRLHTPGTPDILWTPRNEGHWILTRFDAIGKAFLDTEHFSSKVIFLPKSRGLKFKFNPVSLDPPEHGPFRALVNRAIGPQVVARLQDSIEEVASRLVDELAPRGQCDFVKDFAEPYPFRILLGLLDLPIDDVWHLKMLTDRITRPDGTMTMDEACQGFYDYLRPVIERRRANPGKDAISEMVNGLVNGRLVTVEEAQNMCAQVTLAGLDTVVNFSSFAMQFLASSPEHRRELIENPELVPKAREELLRRFSVAAVSRYIKKDVVVGGIEFREGDIVVVPPVLPGLDERVFDDPMKVDFHREGRSHMTFGYGPHTCAGASLARREIDAVLKTWLRRIPEFELASGARIMHYGGSVGAIHELPLTWDPATTRTNN